MGRYRQTDLLSSRECTKTCTAISCGQSAEPTGYSKRTSMESLGTHGVAVMDHPTSEREDDLGHARRSHGAKQHLRLPGPAARTLLAECNHPATIECIAFKSGVAKETTVAPIWR
jgi:hypothetical protein